MRRIGAAAAVVTSSVIAAGCGWSPPSAAPTTSVPCSAADGPTGESIATQITALPAGAWREAARGHAADCRLHWVVVTAGDAPDSPQQVLFFDRQSPLGTPTPEPRPYITVTSTGDTAATVQYQWRRNAEPACCPTGIGSMRVTVEDGKLKVLDPVPSP